MDNKNRLITIRQRLSSTIAIFLVISAVLIFSIGLYIKNETLTKLALKDARDSSQFIFENLYTKMQEGWSKEDINAILKRLNTIRPGMEIYTYRSSKVEELYGRVQEDYEKVESDKLLKEAMNGKEIIKLYNENRVRYIYPIRVEKRCIECHKNVKEGDINGVIDIDMPVQYIISLLNNIILYFAIALLFLIAVFFAFFYKVFDKKLVVPLKDFSEQILSLKIEPSDKNTIVVKSDLKELKSLENSFNELMGKINYYYKELLSSFMIDPLTKLGNIYRLKNDLEEKKSASMLLLNIDRFKELNDYYGFELGDKVLKEISIKLKSIIPSTASLYRIGGSEFAIVNFDRCDISSVERIMEHIHNLEFADKELEGLRVTLTAGIVESEQERLLEKASIALNAAKKRKKQFEYYQNSIDLEDEYKRHVYWMREIEQAIKESRVVPFFQPIRGLKEENTQKYEVLARLLDKDGDIHVPAEFLEVAQKSRLYADLTKTIIDKSFEYFKNLECGFCINLSINDIKDSNCIGFIYGRLNDYPNPQRVTFEILESEEISDFKAVNEFIEKVHQYGAKIAIDDFGSGYSNFHYLLKMKVDYYKIDASLIRYLEDDEDSKMLVESIVKFAKRLGIKTIAEYVENKEIADICSELGIDYLQGYYIGKPVALIKDCHKIKKS